MPKRIIVVRPPPGVDVERFLDRLSKAITASSAVYKIHGGSIRIVLHGTDTQLRETIRRVKQLIEEYSEGRRGRLRRYQWRRIYSDAGGAVPLDAVAQALRMEGYQANTVEGGIETDAPYEEVASVAQQVWNTVSALAGTGASRSVKKAIAAVVAAGGGDPLELLEEAIRLGLARDEDGHVIPSGDWRWISETLLNRQARRSRGD